MGWPTTARRFASVNASRNLGILGTSRLTFSNCILDRRSISDSAPGFCLVGVAAEIIVVDYEQDYQLQWLLDGVFPAIRRSIRFVVYVGLDGSRQPSSSNPATICIDWTDDTDPVSYTHLTLPTNREV